MKTFVLLLLVVTQAVAQLANQPPAPLWLSGSASVEKEFTQSGKLLKAILLVASDGPVSVEINDEPEQQLQPKDIATSLDLTRFIKPGSNRLRLVTHGKRVAALLELNGDLANKTWLKTDGSWIGATTTTPIEAKENPFDLKNTFDAYNSWQLAKPGAQNQATPAESLTLLPGFKAELVRSAQPGEDSWVSMAFDPKGRITLGKEKKGLLRFDPKTKNVEVIDDKLLECRGLLYAHGALYANANNSKGLFRLRDTDGDDRFDESTELLHTEGGVGHGRNHIKLGPEGDIYIAHGNNVLLPTNISEKSPLKNYHNDQLLPNPWDNGMFDGNVELPAGHILRMKPDGSEVQLLAGGLRNPLDIAFNHEGDLFTFDADMERDVGAPWYMPTRVLHVVPGADFGWRRGTGRYPSYYIDTLPSVIDIGLASPTATFFGYGAKFPAKYQDAYFIMDWSYGRIIAVHLKPRGSSYGGEQETFVSGRPLNVTDGCIGPDGAMWFITGGRGTQSGLYRVSYESGENVTIIPVIGSGPVRSQQAIADDPPSVELSLQNLGSDDSNIRLAARLVLANTDPSLWVERALIAERPRALVEGCLCLIKSDALADAKRRALDALLCAALPSPRPSPEGSSSPKAALDGRGGVPLPNAGRARSPSPIGDSVLAADYPWERAGVRESIDEANVALRLHALRDIALAIASDGKLLNEDYKPFMTSCLEERWSKAMSLTGSSSTHLRWEITKLLIYLKSPNIIAKATDYLKTATTSEDLLFYPMNLRYLKDGWTLDQRRIVFEALNRAEKMNGASSYFKAIADTRAELAAALTAEEAKALADVIAVAPAPLNVQAMPAHSYKQWKLADLEKRLPEVDKGRSYASAKKAIVGAQCVFCHRVSAGNELPAGIIGPDLTQVSARFGRKDLLMHILEPSAFIDEKFRTTMLTKTDGTQVIGMFEREDDERVVLKPNALVNEVVEVAKAQIKERKLSDVSPMPPGLLNVLKPEQILDVLAWFESGGDATKAAWK